MYEELSALCDILNYLLEYFLSVQSAVAFGVLIQHFGLLEVDRRANHITQCSPHPRLLHLLVLSIGTLTVLVCLCCMVFIWGTLGQRVSSSL